MSRGGSILNHESETDNGAELQETEETSDTVLHNGIEAEDENTNSLLEQTLNYGSLPKINLPLNVPHDRSIDELNVPQTQITRVKTVINRCKKSSSFRFIVTNARFLRPKIGSLCCAFNELELHVAVVSESWLRPGPELDAQIADIEDG